MSRQRHIGLAAVYAKVAAISRRIRGTPWQSRGQRPLLEQAHQLPTRLGATVRGMTHASCFERRLTALGHPARPARHRLPAQPTRRATSAWATRLLSRRPARRRRRCSALKSLFIIRSAHYHHTDDLSSGAGKSVTHLYKFQ
ncbi:MAG TPA: hypothetical protein VLE49_18935 [Anaerolineales bacterium]|nr:hypothetical protein [Anaerolineales bacterium]